MDYDAMIVDAMNRGDRETARVLLRDGRHENVLRGEDYERLRDLVDPVHTVVLPTAS